MADFLIVSSDAGGRRAAERWRARLLPHQAQLTSTLVERGGQAQSAFVRRLDALLRDRGVGCPVLACDAGAAAALLRVRRAGTLASWLAPRSARGCFLLLRHWDESSPLPRRPGWRRQLRRGIDINLFSSATAARRLQAHAAPARLVLSTPVIAVDDGQPVPPDGLALGRLARLLANMDAAQPDWRGIELSYVTHFYLNQGSPDAVFALARRYAAYAADVLDRVHFVFVDDGSPLDYTPPELDLNVTWAKIADDIPWNMAGARNLGVMLAKSERVVLCDIDVEFPEASLRALCKQPLARDRLDAVNDYDPVGRRVLDRSHPNAWVIARSRFLETAGLEEAFAGDYGCEDTYFPHRLKALGLREGRLPRAVHCFARADINRARGYHDLGRDHTHNRVMECLRRRDDQWYGVPWGGHSRTFLNFAWRILGARTRERRAQRRILRRNWMRGRVPRIIAEWLRG